MSADRQIDITAITLKFTSSTGEYPPEMEKAFEELERVIDYRTRELCNKFPGLNCERESE